MAAPQKLLSESQFQSLVRRLRKVLAAAHGAAADQKLAAFWQVGEIILGERIASDVGYHNAVLRDVARETGLALRTLQRTVVFRQTYPAPPQGNGLSWSHYRVLLQLPSKKQREFYIRLARNERWNTRELEAAVAADFFAGGALPDPELPRPLEPSYLYKAQVIAIVDGDTLDLLIDLGFSVLTRRRVRLARLDAPDVDTKQGRAARTFAAENLRAARTIVVQTLKTDLYGRFVVHLFYSPTDLTIADCFASGTHLNDLLVRAGHAVVLP